MYVHAHIHTFKIPTVEGTPTAPTTTKDRKWLGVSAFSWNTSRGKHKQQRAKLSSHHNYA